MTSTGIVADGIRNFDIPCEPFDLYGLSYSTDEGGFYRVPVSSDYGKRGRNVLRQYGGRKNKIQNGLVDPTRSDIFVPCDMTHMPLRAVRALSSLRKKAACILTSRPCAPSISKRGIEAHEPLKGGKMREYVLYFRCITTWIRLRSADETAKIERGERYTIENRSYYGSSITQGGVRAVPTQVIRQSCPSGTTRIYQLRIHSGSARRNEHGKIPRLDRRQRS
ncbi:MAG: hypothetical protein ACLUSP_10065 [Christensenellales bacterium]